MNDKILIVVDMQNDFITGSLANPEAEKIVPIICDKIKNEYVDYDIVLTKDVHNDDYLYTQEGKNLPIPHCIEFTEGEEVHSDIVRSAFKSNSKNRDYGYAYKYTFGVNPTLWKNRWIYDPETIVIVGTCTDICVISNALILKTIYPETKIIIDASCCAGTTIEKHKAALEVMKSCQIEVINE